MFDALDAVSFVGAGPLNLLGAAKSDVQAQVESLSEAEKAKISRTATYGTVGALVAGSLAGYHFSRELGDPVKLAAAGAAIWIVGGSLGVTAMLPHTVDEAKTASPLAWGLGLLPGSFGITWLGLGLWRWIRG